MLIGLEREWREKAAGFRTLTLVSMGCAAFVLAVYQVMPREVARMTAGISTGIGFLGAGTILRHRGEVIGLTTAATVWVAAALGISAAMGAYVLTAVGTALSLFVLLVLPLIDFDAVRSDLKTYEITFSSIEWDETTWSDPFREIGLGVTVIGITADADATTMVFLGRGRRSVHESALSKLVHSEDVISFSIA
jgi:putative Mg2+ transporter-C (MgtC) family protein